MSTNQCRSCQVLRSLPTKFMREHGIKASNMYLTDDEGGLYRYYEDKESGYSYTYYQNGAESFEKWGPNDFREAAYLYPDGHEIKAYQYDDSSDDEIANTFPTDNYELIPPEELCDAHHFKDRNMMPTDLMEELGLYLDMLFRRPNGNYAYEWNRFRYFIWFAESGGQLYLDEDGHGMYVAQSGEEIPITRDRGEQRRIDEILDAEESDDEEDDSSDSDLIQDAATIEDFQTKDGEVVEGSYAEYLYGAKNIPLSVLLDEE